MTWTIQDTFNADGWSARCTPPNQDAVFYPMAAWAICTNAQGAIEVVGLVPTTANVAFAVDLPHFDGYTQYSAAADTKQLFTHRLTLHRDALVKGLDIIETLGGRSVTALLLASGGAIATLLAFLGSFVAIAPEALPVIGPSIGIALGWFFVAVAAAVLTPGLGYIGQNFDTGAQIYSTVGDRALPAATRPVGVALMTLPVLSFIVGWSSLVAGGIKAFDGLELIWTIFPMTP